MTSAWPRIVVENWRRRKWLILFLFLFLLLVLLVISVLGIVPWGYVRSDAIQGRIVDGETGQPIPHATIFMDWPQLLGTIGGTIHVGGGVVAW